MITRQSWNENYCWSVDNSSSYYPTNPNEPDPSHSNRERNICNNITKPQKTEGPGMDDLQMDIEGFLQFSHTHPSHPQISRSLRILFPFLRYPRPPLYHSVYVVFRSCSLSIKLSHEVNRREVCECDGWVCVCETIGVPSKFIVMCEVVTLARMLTTWNCKKSVSFTMIL